MSDKQLHEGASWDFDRTQRNSNENEQEESIALNNNYWSEALTDKINESYEYGE